MAKLVSVLEMQSLEKQADKNGLSYKMMMENAGSALVDEIQVIAHRYYSGEVSILGIVGPGNNGGDTLIALGKLARTYKQVTGYVLYKKDEQRELIENVIKVGGNIIYAQEDVEYELLHKEINNCGIFLDGIFGTGFKLPLRKDIKDVLEEVQGILEKQEIPPIIIAVDCPSGVDTDSGEAAGETISADFTVCMAAVKNGMLRLPAYKHIGELIVVDIGFTEKNSEILEIKNEVASHAMVNTFRIERPLDSHKGTYGTSMVVAGSSSYSGAALLAGEAAYRVGSGLVTMAVPSSLHGILAGHLPEATWILLPHELGSISESAASILLNFVNNADSLLIGCGLGLEDTTAEFIKSFLEESTNSQKQTPRIGFLQSSRDKNSNTKIQLPPLVVDADGLNLLSKVTDWQKLLPINSIITPHPGEMETLTGISKDEIQKDRLGIAGIYAEKWKVVVVLKGAFTIVASPEGNTTTIPVATSALARAGSGDVLAGMITGFLAQGMLPYKAAIAGAWYHAQAGLIAAEQLGSTASVLASDILKAINIAMMD